jgi:hypothetical protein
MAKKKRRRSDNRRVTDAADAPPPFHTTDLCLAIRDLHARREQFLKTRIMLENRRRHLIAWRGGYESSQDEETRKKRMAAADRLIARILDADHPETIDPEAAAYVIPSEAAIGAFEDLARDLGAQMERLAKQLPVAAWVKKVRGFGLINLARVIGEAGDLNAYANPAKLWKRLGLAPYNGRAPSTWKSKGGLSAEEWTRLGYSPRRRAICYVVSESLLKLNDGPYRARYDQAKQKFAAAHPDEKPLHAHKHAMLLMVKLLVRDLWVVWNKGEADLGRVVMPAA